MATFDLGYSPGLFPSRGRGHVTRTLPWTLGLYLLATLMSFILGNTVGALDGLAQNAESGWALLLPATLTFTSIPPFMLGILLIYVFAFGLKWFLPLAHTSAGSRSA